MSPVDAGDRLRSVQAHAVAPVLDGQDVVIAAATASGKTEAAWFPICSRLADHEVRAHPGIKAIYLGPLKALINDQHLRLESLGDSVEIPVHPWHGDVAGGRKRKLMKNPNGIKLITPESLEATFVQEGHRLPVMFAGLQYFVIDELHDFIGTERGAQLQSLMHRLELAIRRRVRRLGLSATLSDLAIAADFLRPGRGHLARIIDNPAGDTAQIQLQLRGYVKSDPKTVTDVSSDDDAPVHANDARSIAEHLYATLRGKDNLVFANSRSAVEAYVDLLHEVSEGRSVPNESARPSSDVANNRILVCNGDLFPGTQTDLARRDRTTSLSGECLREIRTCAARGLGALHPMGDSQSREFAQTHIDRVRAIRSHRRR